MLTFLKNFKQKYAPKDSFKVKGLVVILCASLFLQVVAYADDLSQEIHSVWEKQKPILQAQMEKRLNAGDNYVLYDVEIFTNNLLKYAEKTGDSQILDDLAQLYLIAIPYLVLDKDGYRKWFFTDKSSYIALENPNLAGKEVKLCSCQYLFVITRLVITNRY